MKVLVGKWLLALGVLLTGTSSVQASYVIDDFTTAVGTKILSAVDASAVNDVGTNILGGNRDLYLDVVTNEDDNLGQVRVSTLGRLAMSVPTGMSAVVSVIYDGFAPGFDLTQGGLVDVILMKLIAADTDIHFTLTVTDTGAKTATLAKNPGGPGMVFFNFSDFVEQVGFDATSVASIRLDVGADTPAWDASIDLIQGTTTIPEPTSLALAGFAGIGMAVGAIRRRRQAKLAA